MTVKRHLVAAWDKLADELRRNKLPQKELRMKYDFESQGLEEAMDAQARKAERDSSFAQLTRYLKARGCDAYAEIQIARDGQTRVFQHSPAYLIWDGPPAYLEFAIRVAYADRVEFVEDLTEAQVWYVMPRLKDFIRMVLWARITARVAAAQHRGIFQEILQQFEPPSEAPRG